MGGDAGVALCWINDGDGDGDGDGAGLMGRTRCDD